MSPQALAPPSLDYVEIRVEPRAVARRRRTPVPASPRTGPSRTGRPWVRLGLGSAVVAGLAYFAHDALTGAPEPPPETGRAAAALTAPPPAWQPVLKPVRFYALDAPDLKNAAFSARRHVTGTREDTLLFGAFEDGGRAHVRLRLSRTVGEAPAPPRFFIDTVRRAAEAGLAVTRSAQSVVVPTKFGPVEAGEVELDAGFGRTCLAFRFLHPEVGFGLDGWLCPPESGRGGPPALACLLDRLTLSSAADDPTLKVLFAQAERRRGAGCRGARLASAR